MKVAFDHNVPVGLGAYLKPHEMRVAAEMGWDLLANGNLLREAESLGFDVLITCDEDFKAYKGRPNRRIAILYLTTNHWPTLLKSCSEILAAMEGLVEGGFAEVGFPSLRKTLG